MSDACGRHPDQRSSVGTHCWTPINIGTNQQGGSMKTIKDLLDERILIIDGAMGTMIQHYKLAEADYRGDRFKDWPSDLKGNNDLLCLTQPQIVKEIHKNYLE